MFLLLVLFNLTECAGDANDVWCNYYLTNPGKFIECALGVVFSEVSR